MSDSKHVTRPAARAPRARRKRGLHLPPQQRARRIAARCERVQMAVAKIDHAQAAAAAKLLERAHALMIEAATKLDGLPRRARPATKIAKTE